jgi:DICT domain-containing protein
MFMKKMIYAAAVLLSVAGSVSFASNSSRSMKENFATCAHADSSWYQNFGQYIVAFDMNSAATTCRAEQSDYRTAGCHEGGQWLQAGYYCEPRDGGN